MASNPDVYKRQVEQRSHFSTDPADKDLIDFFTKVGTAMRGANSITPAMGTAYSLDSEEALGPFIYALKDWNISKLDVYKRQTVYGAANSGL